MSLCRLFAFLRLRCRFSKSETLHTSLPEARMIIAQQPHVDGAREISETLVNIVKALFPADAAKPSTRPSLPATAKDPGGVMIPELQAVLENIAAKQRSEQTT